MSVWAQAANDKPLIEEVVVTAQRIEQNASDVPIALSAYSDPEIRDRQIIGIWDLELNVPSFSYVPNNFGGAQITIRGIGELRAAEAGKGTLVPSAPIHVNSIAGPEDISILEFYDLERVEVLRG
jgi:iron complex outermembrane receptor protein